jgi:hypothetical protein
VPVPVCCEWKTYPTESVVAMFALLTPQSTSASPKRRARDRSPAAMPRGGIGPHPLTRPRGRTTLTMTIVDHEPMAYHAG